MPEVISTASGLQVVTSTRDEDEKVYVCTLCKTEFPETQRKLWERHVGKCADLHEDEIAARVHARKTNPLWNPWDPELRKWHRQHPQGNRLRPRKVKNPAP